MLIVLKLLGSIALLIYGMKVMSEALQKMAICCLCTFTPG